MDQTDRRTDAEVAMIRRRCPAVRAWLACEGMRLMVEEEALFAQFDHERLTPDQRRNHLLEFARAATCSIDLTP